MRAWLLVCAALALAPGRPRAASATPARPAATAAPPAPPAHLAHTSHTTHTAHTTHLATIAHSTHDSHSAHSAHQAHSAHSEHSAHTHTLADPARLDHIKTQILAKLGLRARPRPLGAPPRDVVRQILARAADTHTERPPEEDHSMREIIAIAHRDTNVTYGYATSLWKKIYNQWILLMKSGCRCRFMQFEDVKEGNGKNDIVRNVSNSPVTPLRMALSMLPETRALVYDSGVCQYYSMRHIVASNICI